MIAPATDAPAGSTHVLFVDLDGTLVATDILWEALILAVKRRPWLALKVPLWACRGRAVLKSRLAALVEPDPRDLPYRPEVLDFLRRQKDRGRRIVLATAS